MWINQKIAVLVEQQDSIQQLENYFRSGGMGLSNINNQIERI
jgi:hypothetical protein